MQSIHFTRGRFLAVVLLLLAPRAGLAQLPVAPPPHPTLDDVVKEYLRLGLPLPPEDAELVRIHRVFHGNPDEAEEHSYLLGFCSPPRKQFEEPRYFLGWGSQWSPDYLLNRDVELVKPSRDAIKGRDQLSLEVLCLAVHSKLRGWDELANAAYRVALEDMGNSPITELRELKWILLSRKIHQRGSDRKKIYEQMKPLAEFDTDHVGGQFAYYPHLLQHLELTIAPRKSKPGTPEWLIDDLVNYWLNNREYWDGEDAEISEVGRESYFKLVEMGFDAVPALIDHFNDERYTYALGVGFAGFICRPTSVGDLAREIVASFAGRPLTVLEARKWFADAQRTGEETYLAAQAAKQDPNVFRAIGVKYPKRLPELYRATLRKQPTLPREGALGPVAATQLNGSVIASKLTKAEKIALFEDAMQVQGHEEEGLAGLAQLDERLFHKRVRTLLEKNPSIEYRELPLILWVEEGPAWAAYRSAWKNMDYEEKWHVLRQVGGALLWKREHDKLRRARLRFLLQFIDDKTPAPSDWGDNAVSIGDLALGQLAGILGFKVKRNPELTVEEEQWCGRYSKIAFRIIVANAAMQELKRRAK